MILKRKQPTPEKFYPRKMTAGHLPDCREDLRAFGWRRGDRRPQPWLKMSGEAIDLPLGSNK